MSKIVLIMVPDWIDAEPSGTDLYGYIHEETGIVNVVSKEPGDGLVKVAALAESPGDGVVGVCSDRGVSFYRDCEPIERKTYQLHLDIFSRNSGILESKLLMSKTAIIVGCGSVGSLVALELARSGVGRFVLVDSDILEYHNVCRHQCGIPDVGRYKVDAVADAIHRINPTVFVEKYRMPMEHVPEVDRDRFCSPDAIVIGCADDRSSDIFSNRVAASYGMPFVSIGFWERAYVGEIFYWIPGRGHPCYECAICSDNQFDMRVQARNHHVYTNEEDLVKVSFEPGISVNLSFVTEVAIMLVLDLLGMGSDYKPRLLNDLTQYTLVCCTSDTEVAGLQVGIFSYPLQVTTSLQVGFKDRCPNGKCRWE